MFNNSFESLCSWYYKETKISFFSTDSVNLWYLKFIIFDLTELYSFKYLGATISGIGKIKGLKIRVWGKNSVSLSAVPTRFFLGKLKPVLTKPESHF